MYVLVVDMPSMDENTGKHGLQQNCQKMEF